MFNKVLLAIIFSLSFSQAADEFSSERLLGIEVGYVGADTKDAIGLTQNLKGVEYGLMIGAQNEEWRTTFHGNFSNSNGNQYQKVVLSFDKFVWQSLYKTDEVLFKPYLGAHVGWIKHTANNISDNGMLYGGGVGLTWNVLNEVDFDLGYKYSVMNLTNLKSMDSMTFGVNYIY